MHNLNRRPGLTAAFWSDDRAIRVSTYRIWGGRTQTRWQSSVVDGFLLMEQGITIRLEGALTSELLVIEATA